MWVLTRNADSRAVNSITEPEYQPDFGAWRITHEDGAPEHFLGLAADYVVSGSAPPPPVPAAISPAQAKIALLRTSATDGTSPSLYDQVDAFIGSLTDPSRREIAIWWRSATLFERASPHIAAVAGAFSLTDAQIDDIFRLAATIV